MSDEDFGRGGLKPYFFTASGVYHGNLFAGKVDATTKLARLPVPAEEAVAQRLNRVFDAPEAEYKEGEITAELKLELSTECVRNHLVTEKCNQLVMSSQI